MKPGGGKQKGAQFERKIARALSIWLSGGQRTDLLWRSAMSGGRATVHARKGEKLAAQAGDLSSIDKQSASFIEAFFVEVKHLREWEFHRLIYGKGTLVDVWTTAWQQARIHHKRPMLIGKGNRQAEFIVVPTGVLPAYMSARLGLVAVQVFPLGATIMALSTFLDFVDPHHVIPADRRPAPDRKRARRLPLEPVRKDRRSS